MKKISSDNESTTSASVGARIVEIRSRVGKTQADFAKILGITQGRLSQIENGTALPTSEIIKAIIDNFSISYDFLMNGISEANNIQQENALSEVQEGYNLPDCRTTLAINDMLKKELEAKNEEVAYLRKLIETRNKEFEFAMQSARIAEQQANTLAGIIDRLTK